MKLALLGGGNMGQAIILALLDKKVVKPGDILVYDLNAEKRAFFAKHHIPVAAADYARLKDYDVVMLAVKPQDMQELLGAIQTYVSPKTLVISIAAGIKIKAIEHYLTQHKIVRTIPNTPAQIRRGVTGWSTNQRVTVSDKKKVERILNTLGISIYFKQEKQIDALASVSASGPAYVFYFMEGLIEGGKQLGLSEAIAQQATLYTVLGAAHLMQATGESPATLRQQVTSKKGMTEAALNFLNSKKTTSIIAEAVKRAWQRTQELATFLKW